MLLQFSCSNHRSILDPITFSMIASKDVTASTRLKAFGGNEVLRIAAIYGPNGSGKSNFINAISFAKAIIKNSLNIQPGIKLNQTPHKLAEDDIASTYDFQFVCEGIRYVYGFSIVKGLIDEEYLYYFPKKRKLKIFERKGLKITPGNKYKGVFTLSEDALKDNRLFLTCAANYSKIKELERAFLFFTQDIIIYKTNIDAPRMHNWYEYSIELMEKNPKVKRAFVEMLKALGTGIVDVKTKIEDIDTEDFSKQLPEPLRNLFLSTDIPQKRMKNFEAKVVYEKFETDIVTEESTGIQKLFQIVCPILDILANGKVLIFDEIETGLHETVVHKMIEFFYNSVPDKFAQLIFSTHDTSLMDPDLFRRDQIWFTQLKPEIRSTDLYSLVEIRNVRKNENLAKGYINGKYDAIPVLNNDFKAFVENIEDS